ncbi:MAG: hypothetical protein ACTSWY_14930 [Promethearchaeota archaeon]
MPELALADLKEWYIERINDVYYSYKRKLSKYLKNMDNLFVDLKNAVKKMKEREEEVDLEEKTAKYLERFYEKVKSNLESVKIPEKPIYTEVTELLDEFKKIFVNMNETGRKYIRHFADKFKLELKEIDMITRKISGQMAKIDHFLRKKYGNVKDAESLLKKIPILESISEKITSSKSTIDNIKKQKEILNNELKSLENQILEIENNPLVVEQEKIKNELFKLRIKFNNAIKFKKPLKKLKKRFESSRSYKDITPDQIKKYITDPINTIARDGENHPQLTKFLVQLRFLLEEKGGTSLKLKADTRDKVLHNIEEIVSEGLLKDIIGQYNRLNKELKEKNQELKEKKLSSQQDDLKKSISLKTQNNEHLEADIKHQSNEYHKLLMKLREERDELQKNIKEYVDEDIKIQITLNY